MHLQICLLAKTVLLIFSQEQIKHMLITTLGWNPSAFQQVCQKCNLTFSTPALYWTQESSLSLSNPIPSSTCDTAENELQVRYQQYSEDSSPVSSHQVPRAHWHKGGSTDWWQRHTQTYAYWNTFVPMFCQVPLPFFLNQDRKYLRYLQIGNLDN